MPSARDLMQKADSLMRSNRSVGVSETDQSIPVLTEVVIPGDVSVAKKDASAAIARESFAATIPAAIEPHISNPAPQSATDQSRADLDLDAIAETVYFEVIRDLDLDSVERLRERLTARLLPIFEEMNREVMARVQEHLADIIRDQVAAAIEEKLRARSPARDLRS